VRYVSLSLLSRLLSVSLHQQVLVLHRVAAAAASLSSLRCTFPLSRLSLTSSQCCSSAFLSLLAVWVCANAYALLPPPSPLVAAPPNPLSLALAAAAAAAFLSVSCQFAFSRSSSLSDATTDPSFHCCYARESCERRRVRARSLARTLPAFEAGPAFKAAFRPKSVLHRTASQGETRAQHTSPVQRHTAQRGAHRALRWPFLSPPSSRRR
jgi:hypothetical protein